MILIFTFHFYVTTFQQHQHMGYISLSWFDIPELVLLNVICLIERELLLTILVGFVLHDLLVFCVVFSWSLFVFLSLFVWHLVYGFWLPYCIFPKNMLTTDACHCKVDACIYTKCVSMHGNVCNVFIEKKIMDRTIIRRNSKFFLNG